MSLTPSNMIPLGTKAPDFELWDPVYDDYCQLDRLKGSKGTVIMFICNHCPYVKHIQKTLVDVARRYQAKGIAFIGINSNDIENHPDDRPERMREVAKQFDYPFAYLFDKTQQVAKDYDAACTPDFYLFDDELLLRYRGQFDDARPGNNKPVTGESLSAAMDEVLAGKKELDIEQKPSMGCNIKWK